MPKTPENVKAATNMTAPKPQPTDAETPPEPTRQPTRQRVVRAIQRQRHAISHGLWADHKAKSGDSIGALAARHDASQIRERADSELSRWAYTTENVKPRGNGGELMTLPEPEDPVRREYKRQVVGEAAGVLEHQASSDAMDLAARADVLPLALEMGNSIKAKNRAEKLLAHQAVAMHKLGMNLVARAQNEIDRADRHASSGNVQWRQIANVEAARATNAAARAFSAFSEAMLTLQKLRTGGKQVVQVQHVTVSGGQAVVGQNVKSGRKGGGRKRGGRSGKQ